MQDASFTQQPTLNKPPLAGCELEGAVTKKRNLPVTLRRSALDTASVHPVHGCIFGTRSYPPDDMVTDKIKELAATKAKVSKLEASIAAELHGELASLPARFGFSDAKSFLTAVKAACGKRRGRKPGTPNAAAPKRRKRAKITDETRAAVKKLVDGGKTGGEIAKSLGISLPSVQNIKKALGLVKKR